MKMTTPTIGTQIAGLLALVFAAVGAHAQELVPPDQAFTYTVSDDAGELEVDWQVKPGNYLYKKKLS